MINILITGANSYVGIACEKWFSQWPDEYYTATLDMLDEDWDANLFYGYDVILHVAGIVHIKETKANKELYYKINRDLAYRTALKAKKEGVRQFIYLSSMNIFGIDHGIIDINTFPIPKSSYGKSKIEGEKLLATLSDNSFKILILRPPMIYGKNCKGNYQKLSSFIKKYKIFPKTSNCRSMLYIDNLCEFIRQQIHSKAEGILHPENSEYVKIVDLVSEIATTNKIDVTISPLFNGVLKILKFFAPAVYFKLFDSLVYSENIKNCLSFEKEICFKDSIKFTENGN